MPPAEARRSPPLKEFPCAPKNRAPSISKTIARRTITSPKSHSISISIRAATIVTATSKVTRTGAANPLVLDGEELKLVSVTIDGRMLGESEYALTPATLTLRDLPDAFTLEIVTEISPENNTTLNGLYTSKGMFCTQCEAEGFRRITYFLDRPDNLAVYTTRIEADKKAYPILLSNGNPIARGDLAGGKHFVTWNDPFPKPCYLFALVAGDLGVLHDSFVTMSGRKVALAIYVEHGNETKVTYAMDALKRSMRWDEEKYGREYDLDIFMIVAVSAFNFGAMENKGLNIFNDKLLLASPETATDDDYGRIESVVAHEYFHNWTGDRITCRDWFQLSLKEGLTVFRDQMFSADMRSEGVKRIEDVRMLRMRQFMEDSGPLAHAVQPQSYITIDNFYTATIYEKGSEVIRMLQTLVGKDGYRKATDLYFKRHDGQAATVEDWVKCFEDACGRDLTQFRRWYSQAGTPTITAKGHYDAARKMFDLTLTQEPGADAGPAGEGADAHPGAAGLHRPERQCDAADAGRRDGDGARRARAGADPGGRDLPFRRRGADAAGVAGAAFLGAGAFRHRLHGRRTRLPDEGRHRRFQPLGSGAEAVDQHPAGGGGERRQAVGRGALCRGGRRGAGGGGKGSGLCRGDDPAADRQRTGAGDEDARSRRHLCGAHRADPRGCICAWPAHSGAVRQDGDAGARSIPARSLPDGGRCAMRCCAI